MQISGSGSMVDRTLHHAEIVHLEGQSYRAKEAAERATHRRKKPKKQT